MTLGLCDSTQGRPFPRPLHPLVLLGQRTRHDYGVGFLKFGTVDILGQIYIFVGCCSVHYKLQSHPNWEGHSHGLQWSWSAMMPDIELAQEFFPVGFQGQLFTGKYKAPWGKAAEEAAGCLVLLASMHWSSQTLDKLQEPTRHAGTSVLCWQSSSASWQRKKCK